MSELIAIYGARGSGKSTKARELTKNYFRRIVLDPSRDWEKRGVKPVRDLPQLAALIAEKWRAGFDVTYTPPPGKEALALHHISTNLCAYQEKLYRGKPSQEIMLVVDEMAEAYSNADAMRANLSGFRRVILQGRHFGISVVGITQRPADVSTRYRDNCARSFIFALHDHNSRDALLSVIGREHAATLRGLKPFEFLMAESGVITKGRTKPD